MCVGDTHGPSNTVVLALVGALGVVNVEGSRARGAIVGATGALAVLVNRLGFGIRLTGGLSLDVGLDTVGAVDGPGACDLCLLEVHGGRCPIWANVGVGGRELRWPSARLFAGQSLLLCFTMLLSAHRVQGQVAALHTALAVSCKFLGCYWAE